MLKDGSVVIRIARQRLRLAKNILEKRRVLKMSLPLTLILRPSERQDKKEVTVTTFAHLADVADPASISAMTIAGIGVIGSFLTGQSIGKLFLTLETDFLLFSFVMPFPNQA